MLTYESFKKAEERVGILEKQINELEDSMSKFNNFTYKNDNRSIRMESSNTNNISFYKREETSMIQSAFEDIVVQCKNNITMKKAILHNIKLQFGIDK